MKTMIHCLSGALMLIGAPIATADGQSECGSGECCQSTAAAATTTKTTAAAQKECGKPACKDKSKCAEAKVADGWERVRYVVKGMTCGGCAKSITASLEKVDGVTVRKVSPKSGCAVVDYDPTKVKKSDVAAAISKGKFSVTAERLVVPVQGMSCSKCSDKITAALNAIDGVKVKAVSHKGGKAVVDIDPSKSSRSAVVKAITAAGFKAS